MYLLLEMYIVLSCKPKGVDASGDRTVVVQETFRSLLYLRVNEVSMLKLKQDDFKV